MDKEKPRSGNSWVFCFRLTAILQLAIQPFADVMDCYTCCDSYCQCDEWIIQLGTSFLLERVAASMIITDEMVFCNVLVVGHYLRHYLYFLYDLFALGVDFCGICGYNH